MSLTSCLRGVVPGVTVSVSALAALGVVAALSACPIVDDERNLPGAACASDRDCGTRLVCAANVCVPDDGAIVTQPPVGCAGKGDGDACSDGDACTEGDACSAGACVGTAKQCGANQACSNGVCIDLGSCTLTGAPSRLTTTGTAQNASIAYDVDKDDLAVVYEDSVTGISEIWFQLADDTGAPRGAALKLTDGTPADANDIDHPSFEPSVVYNPDQKEFGIAFAHVGSLLAFSFAGDVFAMTVTSNGVPAGQHEVTVTEAGEEPHIAWTGATYGAAWVNGTQDDSGNNTSTVEFSALKDDASKIGLSEKTLSDLGASPPVALAFDARTASFGVAYRVDGSPGTLTMTTTNVDGDAAVTTPISGAGDPHAPAIAIVSSGYALVWQDDPGGTGLGALDFAIVSDGLVASSTKVVSDNGEECGRPSLTTTATGLALAYAAKDSQGALEIRVRTLADDGTPSASHSLGPGQLPRSAALANGLATVFEQVSTDGTHGDAYAASSCLQ